MITDSLSIKLVKNDVFRALGNQLIKESSEGKEENKISNVTRDKISGIDASKNLLLVHGGCELVLFDIEALEEKAKGTFTDGISSAKFLENGQVCILTAHSVLLRLSSSDNSFNILEKLSSIDKSTLYCSHLVGRNWDDLIVLGGNAFGEVLIWRATERQTEKVPLIHRISAHQGVLFSINVSLKHGLMTTTSDDRSVKFWNFSSESDQVCVKPFRSGFAHTARVFQAKVVEEDHKPYVISVGEDSYICLWSCAGDLVYKRRQHFGATIWNFDYNPTTKHLHTIGSDGNHLILNLEKFFHPREVSEIPFHSPNDYLAKVVVCKDVLVSVTNQNKAYYRDGNEWKDFPSFSNFKCTVLKTYHNLIIFAGYKRLSIFELSKTFVKLLDEDVMEGVIRSVLPLDKNTFLVGDEQGKCKVLNTYSTDSSKTINLPKSKEMWITSALQLEANLIVLSNRMGHLLLYKEEDGEFVLKDELRRVHGNLGATSIHLLRHINSQYYIQTSGHDSCLRTIKIDIKDCKMKVATKQVIPVSWVEKIENGFHYGFNDNHFVVWSKNTDFEVEIQCGGGHRCWDYIRSQHEFSLFFIKNRKLLVQKVPFNQLLSSVNQLWHLKPCNELEVCDGRLFSAGEENVLKIWRSSEGRLTLQSEIHSHISSIKTVKVQRLQNQSYLIFSAGGRAQICINELSEANIVEERLNFMLKNNDFERKFHRNPQDIDFDPETRFMSLDVLRITEEVFKIFIGCSDGYLRVFKFDLKEGSIDFVSEEFFERCFLHVKVLSESGILLTSTTDGFIKLWDLNDLENVLFSYRHHESGANALDVFDDGKNVHVCTGGDDQAIVYSKVSIDDRSVQYIKRFEGVHTSQVNGVRFDISRKCFYTFGVDQDVYRVSLEDFDIRKIYFSSVADSKGLNISGKYCFVYGSGIDWFEINNFI